MNTLNNELRKSANEYTDDDWVQFRANLVDSLKTSTLEVTFTKKDGTERVMTCTLDPAKLPPAPIKENATSKKENLTIVSAYDLNADGWRSFIVKNVKQVKVI